MPEFRIAILAFSRLGGPGRGWKVFLGAGGDVHSFYKKPYHTRNGGDQTGVLRRRKCIVRRVSVGCGYGGVKGGLL